MYLIEKKLSGEKSHLSPPSRILSRKSLISMLAREDEKILKSRGAIKGRVRQNFSILRWGEKLSEYNEHIYDFD